MKIDNWKITETELNQNTYLENNTIFSLANGYFGTRGNLEESTSLLNNDGTFINGFYDKENYIYPNSSILQAKERQKMLFAPNAKAIDIFVNGVKLNPLESMNYSRELDLSTAIVTKKYEQEVKKKKVSVVSKRIVSLKEENLMSIKTIINSTGNSTIKIVSHSEFFKIFEQEKHLSRKTRMIKQNPLILKRMIVEKMDEQLAHFITDASGLDLFFGVKFKFNKDISAEKFGEYEIELKAGEELIIEKSIYYNWKNHIFKDYENLVEVPFLKLELWQKEIMDNFWSFADIKIEGESELQASMRFNVFSLFQNTGRKDFLNVCAKGLTGEGYDGHYFWDTEIFVIPYFIYTQPKIAKSLIEYRYKILPQAIARAKELGYEGALFPWRTINGNETSPYFPAGTAQVHINADIAYSIMQYVNATDDFKFLETKGLEMLKQITLFYLSYIDFIPGKGYGLNMVTGPDEYTALVNNNAYTNFMVKRVFEYVVELSSKYKDTFKTLLPKLKKIIPEIYIPREKNNLIQQSDGFFEKSKWPFGFEKKPLLSHYHSMVIYKYQITKQADLILAMNLLPEYFSSKELIANYDYYKKITTHDSSLSKCSYAQLASHIGKTEEAFEYFVDNVKTDLYNSHKNTADGVHIASQAGSWQIMVFGFAGMQIIDNKLSFKNNLPKKLKSIEFDIRYKGRLLNIKLNSKELLISRISGEWLEIYLNGKLKIC